METTEISALCQIGVPIRINRSYDFDQITAELGTREKGIIQAALRTASLLQITGFSSLDWQDFRGCGVLTAHKLVAWAKRLNIEGGMGKLNASKLANRWTNVLDAMPAITIEEAAGRKPTISKLIVVVTDQREALMAYLRRDEGSGNERFMLVPGDQEIRAKVTHWMLLHLPDDECK